MGGREPEELRVFLRRVKEAYNPERMILFGSRARGDHLKDSDYDLIIVSEKFRGVHFLERISRLLELLDEDVAVDLLPYTPEEFEKKRREIGIVRKAVEEGVEI
ncbi:MAG: nucleotidyltransferase domain-containing protein [Candidatus Freyarchaeota archaeon]|nr:nucleotidyltransferase domain-containing protein [Candidatus Freyrarchaeum guaymaensis]